MVTKHPTTAGTAHVPPARVSMPNGTALAPAGAWRHYLSASSLRINPRQRFFALAQEWHAATDHLSSPSQIAMHPAYQRIIGMGVSAIPFIFEDLSQRGGQWYWALRAITGASPVPSDASRRSRDVKKAWLRWAIDNGYAQ